jgi:hypothetical protein
MKKLPENARRVIVNGNPSIAYEDEAGNIIRLERDVETELARKPVCARYAKPKTRVAKPGEVV